MELSKQTAAEVAADKHIRDVIDATYRKPNLGSVTTPREDTRRLHPGATSRDLAVDCECIVEMYELLWRWGNLDRFKNRNFFMRFGFSLPESIVFVRGRPYAWYFMSQKDGSLLRKKSENLTIGNIEKRLCTNRNIATHGEICATWIPMSSQFADERSKTLRAMFLTPAMCSTFLKQLEGGLTESNSPQNQGVATMGGASTMGTSGIGQEMHGRSPRCAADYRTFYGGDNRFASGVLQEFCVPNGVSNYLIRAVEYKGRISIAVRTNRQCMIPSRYLKAKKKFEEAKEKQAQVLEEKADFHTLTTRKLVAKAKINTAVVQKDVGGHGSRSVKTEERLYHKRVHTDSCSYTNTAMGVFLKAATFEGWAGLSGVTYGYEKRCKNQADLYSETVVEEEATRKMTAAQRDRVKSKAHQMLAQTPMKLMGTNQALLTNGASTGSGGAGNGASTGNGVSGVLLGDGEGKASGDVDAVNSAAEEPYLAIEDCGTVRAKLRRQDDDQDNEVWDTPSLEWWQQRKQQQNHEWRNRYIDRIVPVAKALMARIKQERVRQMHFLQSHQFIALHFKIDRFKKFPNFIFASIIPENDVIVQCQEHLVMSTNESMKERLPREVLLRGGVVHLTSRRKLFLGNSADGIEQGEYRNYMRPTTAFEVSTTSQKFEPPKTKQKKKKKKPRAAPSQAAHAEDESDSSSDLTCTTDEEDNTNSRAPQVQPEEDCKDYSDTPHGEEERGRETVVLATEEDYSMEFDSPSHDGKSPETHESAETSSKKSILRKSDIEDNAKRDGGNQGEGRRLSFAPTKETEEAPSRSTQQSSLAAKQQQQQHSSSLPAGKQPERQPERITRISAHPERSDITQNGGLNRPKLRYPYPKIPEAPFRPIPVPRQSGEAGRFEYPPPFLFGMSHIKHPLVKFNKKDDKNGFDKIT